MRIQWAMPSRFNEAGPQGAGKPLPALLLRTLQDGASMRPARKGPENRRLAGGSRRGRRRASMRPARKGPENPVAVPPVPPRGRLLQ